MLLQRLFIHSQFKVFRWFLLLWNPLEYKWTRAHMNGMLPFELKGKYCLLLSRLYFFLMKGNPQLLPLFGGNLLVSSLFKMLNTYWKIDELISHHFDPIPICFQYHKCIRRLVEQTGIAKWLWRRGERLEYWIYKNHSLW